MITFFSIPKAFTGHFNIIQRNAIRSWLLGSPGCEIILFGNDDGTEEVTSQFGVKQIKECAVTSYGTPRLDDIFNKAQSIARHDLMCYINADIILTENLADVANKITETRLKSFLTVGRRIDFENTELLSFGNTWQHTLLDHVTKHGRLQSDACIDYFLFPKGLWKQIPPFAIGRTSWDNWLIYEARRLRATVIDATKVVHAFHQNHDYSHVRGGENTAWKGEEAQHNRDLAGGYQHCFTIEDATIKLTPAGLKRQKLTWRSLRRRTKVWLILHPGLLRILKRLPWNFIK